MARRRCNDCGQRNPADRGRCAWCGAPMSGPVREENASAKKRFRLFLVGLVIFIVAAVLILSRVRGG